MTSPHTIATIYPGRKQTQHHDVDEVQVNRDGSGKVGLWLKTSRGPLLLRDQHMLDELAAQLVRLGYGARQEPLEGAER
jgi:hypothetical protein